MTTVLIRTQSTRRTAWSGAFLVSGACIGGGMLVMPIQAVKAGVLFSLLEIFVCWVFMTFTGLLLMESAFWKKQNSHFSSLAEGLLGKGGKIVSLVVYCFMNYVSLVAYTSGGASLINHWSESWFRLSLGHFGGCVVFTLLFGAVVYIGASWIGKINAFFMVAMGLIYCILVSICLPLIQSKNFSFQCSFWEGIGPIPLILAAFSYQMIVPSLCSYLQYDLKESRRSILWGTTTSCIVYSLWLLIIHGIIPFEGEKGLYNAFLNGSSATEPLKHHFINGLFLQFFLDGFAFFALVTSYLSLSLALYDFIFDFFKGIKIQLTRNVIIFLSLFPSLCLAILYPRALLEFLDLSGGFGDAILSCLIPIAMVWVGRYKKNVGNFYQVAGGKRALILAASFAVFVFLLQIFKLNWHI